MNEAKVDGWVTWLLSQVSDHPSDEDLSLGTPVKSETWGTHFRAD
jgi:hypothetical protein